MIIDKLNNCSRYNCLHKFFKPAFDFLTTNNLADYEEGRYDILKDEVYLMVSNAVGRGKAKSSLEAHRKYIDIQVALSGEDLLGYKPLLECKTEKNPYDPDKDCIFFKDKSNFWFKLKQGEFAIFFPEDGHAPLAGVSLVKKAVVKVRV